MCVCRRVAHASLSLSSVLPQRRSTSLLSTSLVHNHSSLPSLPRFSISISTNTYYPLFPFRCISAVSLLPPASVPQQPAAAHLRARVAASLAEYFQPAVSPALLLDIADTAAKHQSSALAHATLRVAERRTRDRANAAYEWKSPEAKDGEGPENGLAEPSKDCRRLMSTWMTNCVFGL